MPVSDKSFPPPPPSFPPNLPPHPKNNHTVIRRQCCETFQSSCNVPSHLATCQLSCNVTTSSKCAICDKLQEKIRRSASRPAQKVTGPACDCVGQKFPTPSPTPPSPKPPPHPPHPKNNHTVIRRQCCETFQASCNVPSILQRAKHLATCQLSCNLTTYSTCAIFDELQEKVRSIASDRLKK